MRVLILDEDSKRARETARVLGEGGAVAEPAGSGSGLGRLEGGEWFDLVVAEAAAAEAGNRLVDRFGRIPSAPPLLLVTPPGTAPPRSPAVHGVLVREPGYLHRLPEAARLTVLAHRHKVQADHLQSRLSLEREIAASCRETLRARAGEVQEALHSLLHALHAAAASGNGEEAGSDPPAGVQEGLVRAETAWERFGDLMEALRSEVHAGALTTKRFATGTDLVRETLAAALTDAERDRLDVEVAEEARVYGCIPAVSAALGQLLRQALAGSASRVRLRLAVAGDRLTLGVPWPRGEALPDVVREVAGDNGGEARLDGGTAILSLPAVRDEEAPGVLVEESLRLCALEGSPFTLMKFDGGSGGPLDPARVVPVIKRSDRVLPSPEGGLFLLMHRLAAHNVWGVAERVRTALGAGRSGILAFRSLSYPTEAPDLAEFMEMAVSTGLLPGAEATVRSLQA